MKTTFKFWGGLTTIGGNIMEIRYGNDRIIFDFGRNYNPADVLLTSAKGREHSKVADMLKLKMIPHIDGIYESAHLEQAKLELMSAADSPFNTGVFISHLHLDHMGAIEALSPNLPLYMSEPALELYNVLVAIGEEPEVPQIQAFTFEAPLQVGAIQITPFQVDHDTVGASSFLIETPDMKILNSGDLRMHGQHPEWNIAWMEKMAPLNVDYLLIEGTTFFPPIEGENRKRSEISEQDVPTLLASKLQETPGAAFFNNYHRNIDRLRHLIEGAKSANRKTVFEPATAKVVAHFLPDAEFLVLGETISVESINENPGGYLIQNSFANIFNLVDYNLEKSLYFHTNGVPLGPFDPAYGSMLSFLETLGIEFASLSTSGHASQEAILSIIDTIKPKTVVPWHSLAPETMVPNDPNQLVLRADLETWY